MRKARYDLRYTRGLVECAFFLLRTFGEKRKGEDSRPSSFARRHACALITVAQALDPQLPEDPTRQFWHEFEAVQTSIDAAPAEWLEAINELRDSRPELLEAAVNDSLQYTERLIESATAAMSEPDPIRTLGLIFLEIAESRRLAYRLNWKQNLKHKRDDLLRSSPCGVGHHRIFRQFTNFRRPERKGKEFAISPDARGQRSRVRRLNTEQVTITIAGLPPPTVAFARVPERASAASPEEPTESQLRLF